MTSSRVEPGPAFEMAAAGGRTLATSWLELSGPRKPAHGVARTAARMTMSMLPWITPTTEPVVEDNTPTRMTMTRQVAIARTTIGRQR